MRLPQRPVGTLLFEALHRAADRGVRVRLLLDDFNAKGLDTLLATLDSHPNIEVRLGVRDVGAADRMGAVTLKARFKARPQHVDPDWRR